MHVKTWCEERERDIAAGGSDTFLSYMCVRVSVYGIWQHCSMQRNLTSMPYLITWLI
jgi:hypothetical protein